MTEVPVPVTLVGTGTGDGGTAPLTTGTVATTPGPTPNILVKVVPPILAIFVRFVNLFGTSFLSTIGVGAMTDLIPISNVKTAVMVAFMAASLGAVKDIVTIFAGLERKYPLLSGSV